MKCYVVRTLRHGPLVGQDSCLITGRLRGASAQRGWENLPSRHGDGPYCYLKKPGFEPSLSSPAPQGALPTVFRTNVDKTGNLAIGPEFLALNNNVKESGLYWRPGGSPRVDQSALYRGPGGQLVRGRNSSRSTWAAARRFWQSSGDCSRASPDGERSVLAPVSNRPLKALAAVLSDREEDLQREALRAPRAWGDRTSAGALVDGCKDMPFLVRGVKHSKSWRGSIPARRRPRSSSSACPRTTAMSTACTARWGRQPNRRSSRRSTSHATCVSASSYAGCSGFLGTEASLPVLQAAAARTGQGSVAAADKDALRGIPKRE